MRINKFVAKATGLSRRAADRLIYDGKITVNKQPAKTGLDVSGSDIVVMNGQTLVLPAQTRVVALNKPTGYVCSRAGQCSRTIYELLPEDLHRLKPIGRLDKDSSGLLLLTDDGDLANQLTHPSNAKEKVYEVELDKSLANDDVSKLAEGLELDDGMSRLGVSHTKGKSITVTMTEGRNRQIRRTFEALGYGVTKLHRTQFGPYHLDKLASKEWKQV